MTKPRPIQHAECGDEKCSFVAMALFGICGWGPTRQAAWDMLCTAMREATR